MSLNVKLTSEARPLTAVALGTALVLVTYVTPMTTLPASAASLSAGPAARAWILSSMSVGLAAGLLAAGVLGDAFGRRRVYAGGLAALAAGAALCAAAWSPWVLVAARILEGLGGAAVIACGLAVLAHSYPPGPPRLHATSVWGASVGVGIAAGGLLSAVLDIGSGWRETYAVTAGLGAVLLLPTLRRVGESRSAAPRRVDLPGLLLFVAGLVLLVAALTQARNGLGAVPALLLVLGVAALAGFALVERRAAQPLVEPRLLGQPRFLAATLGSLTLGTGMIGLASFVPTVAQAGFGDSLWVATVPVLGWAATSVVAAIGVRRLPHPMTGPLPIAVLLALTALGQLTALGAHSTARLMLPMVLTGITTGFLNSVLGREAVASVPADHAAMGSGANNTARYLGAAIGITLFVTVATHTGDGLADGWSNAVLVAAALTLLGALAIVAQSRRTAAPELP